MDKPHAPSALLAQLKQAFPDKLPRHEASPFELGRLLGQQDVIDKVAQYHEKEYRSHVRSDLRG
jgi:hypothetical protein